MATALNTESSSQSPVPYQPQWHSSAPRRVVERYSSGQTAQAWSTWQRYLQRRKAPTAPPFLDGKSPALLWAWPAEWERAELGEIVASLGDSMAISGERRDILATALQMVAAAYALPRLSARLPAESWWDLLESLRASALTSGQARVDWENDPQSVLRAQLLAGELPLALSYQFPELSSMRDLRELACQTLSESIVAMTDGKGLPHARLWSVIGPLVASWTRCRCLASRMNRPCWSGEAEGQYVWLIRQLLRLTNGRGGLMLQAHREQIDPREFASMFATAIELTQDKTSLAIASSVLPQSAVGRRKVEKRLPKPSYASEWARIALLARDWKSSSPRLAISYADESMRIEFVNDRELLFHGPLTFETLCDGKPARGTGEWEELCWHFDKHCVYLEMGIDLESDLRLERQFVLPRTPDNVLFMADSISAKGSAPRKLHHTLRIPLGKKVVWRPESETRDGVLLSDSTSAAVLPLALQEWRVDPRGGSINEEQGLLVLAQERTGKSLYCPLFFDLQRKRIKKERTWRRLTVAETRVEVSEDVAVAFRAQSGSDQWLVYRSMGPAANRTFMGQNISGEFCAGRFPESGEIDEWVEVESL